MLTFSLATATCAVASGRGFAGIAKLVGVGLFVWVLLYYSVIYAPAKVRKSDRVRWLSRWPFVLELFAASEAAATGRRTLGGGVAAQVNAARCCRRPRLCH